MLATENDGSSRATATTSEEAAVAYYSQNVALTFHDDNAIAENPILKGFLDSVPPEYVTRENGQTTFHVNTTEFAHFLHLVYCHTPESKKVCACFDGIWPFEAPDEATGEVKKFNAQLVTISEVDDY